MKNQIIDLLDQGKKYREIQKIVGCSIGVISYHSGKRGIPERKRIVHDWVQVQEYYDSGYSLRECIQRFGFSRGSWGGAVKSGKIVPRGVKPIEFYLHENSRVSRTNLKERMISCGILRNKCYICSIGTVWKGKHLVLVLDHVNGINDDYRLENLRLLCPNCNSQTDTFSGRNMKHREVAQR